MLTPPPPRPRALFLAALELPDGPARAAYLDDQCGTDRNLPIRRRVEELLALASDLGGFLDQAAVHGSLRPLTSTVSGSDPSPPVAMGDRIGRYRLVQEIGAGGCGTVYLAEQEEPVRRQVAMKVIRSGLDSKTVLARFQIERQALAMMDHPNIATVLDAGFTNPGKSVGGFQSGRPFLVMELVRGVRLTQFCDQNGLGTRERLKLFVLVSRAIQHAHQKGVIHRDIKPSNILVAMRDGIPVPKVIDFGIAKAITPDQPGRTPFTRSGTFIGTPVYMSPELAQMRGLDIDARSDIYSLGVLLYELLTGTLPFSEQRLRHVSYGEMQRIIADEEPERPSVRWSRSRVAGESSGAPSFATDLDWIVLRCLEKDRVRRYASTSDLADDVQRFLNHEPILARAPSLRYRLGKFVRRHRASVLVGAGAGVLLCLATGISVWLARRASQAENEQHHLLRMVDLVQRKDQVLQQEAATQRFGARQHKYHSDMNLASQAVAANNFGRVVELLNHYRPPDGELSGADPRQWEWRYYWNQSRSDARYSLPSQTGRIGALVASADGRFLASGDDRGGLKLWDLKTQSEVTSFPKRVTPFWLGPIAFSPINARLFFVANENSHLCSLRSWTPESGETRLVMTRKGGIQAIHVSRTGATLLLLGFDGELGVWDLGREEMTSRISLTPSQERFRRPSVASFSADGRWLALYDSGQIRVVDTDTGKIQTIPTTNLKVASVAISRSGEFLALGASFDELDTRIRLFSTDRGEEIGQLEGPSAWVPSLAFTTDGQRLISAGADQTVRVWDVATRQEKARLRGHHSEVIRVAVSADGATLFSGGKDGSLLVWDAQPPILTKPFEKLPGRVAELQFSPDSRHLLSVDPDGAATIWEASSLKPLERLTGFSGRIRHALVSADGQRVYAEIADKGIEGMDFVSRQVRTFSHGGSAGRWPTLLVGLTHNGQTLVAARGDEAFVLWDVTTAKARVMELPPDFRAAFPARAALSPDARQLVAVGREQRLGVLNLVDGHLDTVATEVPGITGIAFSPDGTCLAISSIDGSASLWNAAKWTRMDVLRGHLLGVHDLAFSPDSQRLATASARNEAIKIWDVASRQEVATLAGDGTLFNRVTFSPDGRLLTAINSQGEAHIWRAPLLDEIQAWEKSKPVSPVGGAGTAGRTEAKSNN